MLSLKRTVKLILTAAALVAVSPAAATLSAPVGPRPYRGSRPETLKLETAIKQEQPPLATAAEETVLEYAYDFEYDYGQADTALARFGRGLASLVDWTVFAFGSVLAAVIIIVAHRLRGGAVPFFSAACWLAVAGLSAPVALCVVVSRSWPEARSEEMLVALVAACIRGSAAAMLSVGFVAFLPFKPRAN